MTNKRTPTAHEKQVRFFLFLGGTVMVLIVVAVIVLLNWPMGGYH